MEHFTSEQLGGLTHDLRTMKDPETMEELMEQLEIISKEMERCEKMMQHLAFSMEDKSELSSYFTDYKELVGMQKRLESKKPKLLAQDRRKEAGDRPWWKPW